MKLTKNERKVMNILIENARVSDSSISASLKISSQAVGKIRRKLESTIINSYSINLNYEKLGISTFAIALAKLSAKNSHKNSLEAEKKFLSDPNIIQAMRLPNCGANYIIIYGFKDMSELDSFFNSQQKKQELHNLIENKELYTFSHNSIIKNSSAQLLAKTLQELTNVNERIRQDKA